MKPHRIIHLQHNMRDYNIKQRIPATLTDLKLKRGLTSPVHTPDKHLDTLCVKPLPDVICTTGSSSSFFVSWLFISGFPCSSA